MFAVLGQPSSPDILLAALDNSLHDRNLFSKYFEDVYHYSDSLYQILCCCPYTGDDVAP